MAVCSRFCRDVCTAVHIKIKFKLEKMVFVKSAAGFGEYALRIIYGYYNESMITCGLRAYRFLDGVSIIFSQSIVYIGLSLFFLALHSRRRKNSSKRGQKHETQSKKKTHQIKRPKVAEYGLDGLDRNESGLQRTLHQCKFVLMILCLVCINILNKLMLYKSMEYISYPTFSIIRSFRLFPAPQSIIGRSISYRMKMSIGMATAGIFIYLFTREEKVESIRYLERLSTLHDPRAIHEYDKVKIVRLSLRFLYFYTKKFLSSSDVPCEEEAFIAGILKNELPPQDYAAPLKDQAQKYYKTLLLLHGNRSKEVVGKAGIKEIFNKMARRNGNKSTPEIDYLALSFVKMICAGQNTSYFHAFLEQRKIAAAAYMAFHSIMEVALEAGQIVLCKRFGVQNDFITIIINLLGALVLCIVLLFHSSGLHDWICRFRKDLFLASSLLYYIRFLSTEEGTIFTEKKDVNRMGLQIGVKFFSLLLSVVLYTHDFTLGHIVGLFLMFISYLININMHTVLLSRWTLSGHVRSRCL
ncbi:hypothetical protein NERG_01562 [Nematocida ausubeli]|uniref:Uncharacterized protein n=1 Tax=Nematocida ausubeli (strain ATCC PRA-371 / ERTm2) TaxID=1913371 RepID=H8ZD91_NEMA1|nr:hypothetical protein NERG_01562 [Nematocida ausubeli]